MKIRNGFVSNSSSSSFVLAVKGNTDKMPIKITIEDDLSEYVEETFKTVEEAKKYYEEEHEIDINDSDENADYLKVIKYIKEGKTVLIIHASDDSGDPIETFLCDNGLNRNVKLDKNIEIIEGKGGY